MGTRSFYQPPFPKKMDEDYEDFHRAKLCLKKHSFTTYCVTRNQQPKVPPIKKNTKWNISSPIRNDRNSCAKDMDFVISVFHDFHMINPSLRYLRYISKKISLPLPYPGQLIFTKSWRENCRLDVFESWTRLTEF